MNNLSSVSLKGNNISFETTWGYTKEKKTIIATFKNKQFDTITVAGLRKWLDTILVDIAGNFQPPKTLDLDLFYAHVEEGKVIPEDGLDEREFEVRDIFKNWTGKDVEVVMRCNEIVVKTLKL
jgi:hypothetical protein